MRSAWPLRTALASSCLMTPVIRGLMMPRNTTALRCALAIHAGPGARSRAYEKTKAPANRAVHLINNMAKLTIETHRSGNHTAYITGAFPGGITVFRPIAAHRAPTPLDAVAIALHRAAILGIAVDPNVECRISGV